MASRPKSLTIKVRVAACEAPVVKVPGLEDGGRASLMLMHAVLGFHLFTVVSPEDRDAARVRAEEAAAASDAPVKVRVPAYYPIGAHLAAMAVGLRHKRLAAYIQLGQDFAAGSIRLGAGGIASTPVAPSPVTRPPAPGAPSATPGSASKMSAPNVDVLDDGLLSSLTAF